MKSSSVVLFVAVTLLAQSSSMFGGEAPTTEQEIWLADIKNQKIALTTQQKDMERDLQARNKAFDASYVGNGKKALISGVLTAGALTVGNRGDCTDRSTKAKIAIFGGALVGGIAFAYYTVQSLSHSRLGTNLATTNANLKATNMNMFVLKNAIDHLKLTDAAEAARQSANAARSSADAASSSADVAKGYTESARQASSDAQNLADATRGHAGDAGRLATAAQSHAGTANQAADTAKGHAEAAGRAAGAARDSASVASNSAGAAQGHAEAADRAADAAKGNIEAAQRAATAVMPQLSEQNVVALQDIAARARGIDFTKLVTTDMLANTAEASAVEDLATRVQATEDALNTADTGLLAQVARLDTASGRFKQGFNSLKAAITANGTIDVAAIADLD